MNREDILKLALDKCDNPVDALAMADMMLKFLTGNDSNTSRPVIAPIKKKSTRGRKPRVLAQGEDDIILPIDGVAFTKKEISTVEVMLDRRQSFELISKATGRGKMTIMLGYYSGVFKMKFRRLPSLKYRRLKLAEMGYHPVGEQRE
jgi:hypothetical protein